MRRALLLIAFSACSNDDKARHLDAGTDTAPPDIDAAIVDAAPQPVTITVTADGAPQMNVHVYFQKADSTVVSATVTDANGSASAMIPPGGYVTAIDPYPVPQAFGGPLGQNVITFAGVQPGDHLDLSRDNRGSGIGVNIIAPPDPNALQYMVYTPCGSNSLAPPNGSGSPNAIGQVGLQNCPAMTDFLIVTYDGNGVVLNSIYKPNITTADHDFSAETYTPAQTRTYTYANTPTDQRNLGVDDRFVTSGGSLFDIQTSLSLAGGPPATATVALPTVAGAVNVVRTEDFPPLPSFRMLVDWGPYASTFSTDFGAHLIPDIATTPAWDGTAHALAWTETTAAQASDFVVFDTSAMRPSDSHFWSWQIAAPHSTKVAFPTLPTDIYDFNYQAADTVYFNALTSAKVPGGYDAIRAHVFSQQLDRLVVGATGSVSASISYGGALQRRKPAPRRH